WFPVEFRYLLWRRTGKETSRDTHRWLVSGYMTMPLLPTWKDKIERLAEEKPAEPLTLSLPRSAGFYAERTTFVTTEAEALAMADLAAQRAVAWIGFDTEFRFDRPAVSIDARQERYDPRSIHPLLLSLSMAEFTGAAQGVLYTFVVDLRRQEVLPALGEFLR